jgi:TM2 domain-containing membrane protein YozV
MTEVCPYCRTKVSADDPSLTCEGCGTLHHVDCYTENGGCTIFGCSKAPADEPKLRVSTPELVSVATQAPVAVTQTRVAPPPRPGIIATHVPTSEDADLRYRANQVVPSIFGGFGDSGRVAVDPPPAVPAVPKNRTTYIVLGALLGAFGAHNFYAGYRSKAAIQLAMTLLTVGFASPMSWVWAVIDICTINQDSNGLQFES